MLLSFSRFRRRSRRRIRRRLIRIYIRLGDILTNRVDRKSIAFARRYLMCLLQHLSCTAVFILFGGRGAYHSRGRSKGEGETLLLCIMRFLSQGSLAHFIRITSYRCSWERRVCHLAGSITRRLLPCLLVEGKVSQNLAAHLERCRTLVKLQKVC